MTPLLPVPRFMLPVHGCHAVPGVVRRGRLPCRPTSSRRASLEVPNFSLGKSVPRLQSADLCVIIYISR